MYLTKFQTKMVTNLRTFLNEEAMWEIVAPDFVETETRVLPKYSYHVLPGEDLEMNNYNVRSIAVHSLAVEVIEIKDECSCQPFLSR